MITVLTGGTGGAKFVEGVAKIVPADQLAFVVNTGDDMKWWGLHISPDVDSICYVLGGVLSRDRGWGFEGDSFRCLERMRLLGDKGWFQIGDLDLATHLRRTQLLADGKTLTETTRELCGSMAVKSTVLPMSNELVETRITTDEGEISFQEYFVRDRYRASVKAVRFPGAEMARPAPGVLNAIRDAEIVLIAPSNPVTSIGPILAVPGIRDALRATNAPVVAVSPIVGGAAVSGPAGEMLKMQGLTVSATGVAKSFQDFLDVMVIDEKDILLDSEVRQLGAACVSVNTIMHTIEEKQRLAEFVVHCGRKFSGKAVRAGKAS